MLRQAVREWFTDRAAAEAKYGPISTWDTSGVTSMSALFCAAPWCDNPAASSFNEDISAWDTSGVTSTSDMFLRAWSFNRPIGGWRVDNRRRCHQP